MYIVNPNLLNQEKLYVCNGIIANWLMTQKSIPLLSKTDSGEFIFAKTDLLKEVLQELPFYLNITRFFA